MTSSHNVGEPAATHGGGPADPTMEPGRAGGLGASAVRNTVAQVLGRAVITAGRLVVARIVVRGLGPAGFGEYSLILVSLSLAEWLLDFGTTDFFVREICREPNRTPLLLRIMTAAKMVQIPVAIAALAAGMVCLGYPATVVRAGLVGGLSLAFFGGVLAYRVTFKESLALEREVAAETVSVAAMIALTWLAAGRGAGLTGVCGAYLASRAVYFGMCFLLGKARYVPSVSGVSWKDIEWCLRSAAAIGAIGALIVVYETIDLLLLSKVTPDLLQVALYSGAQRFAWPVLTALTAMAATLYPIFARHWPWARGDFERACQRGIDLGVLLTGLVAAPVFASAEFCLGLLGASLVPAAPVLRVLTLVLFVKAVSTTLGPVLYVVNAQDRMLKIVILALVLKAGLISILAPRLGAIGVAIGALVADTVAAAASACLVRRCAGYRVRWSVSIRAFIASIAGALVVGRLAGGLTAAAGAAALYCLLTVGSGAARLSDIRALASSRRL